MEANKQTFSIRLLEIRRALLDATGFEHLLHNVYCCWPRITLNLNHLQFFEPLFISIDQLHSVAVGILN